MAEPEECKAELHIHVDGSAKNYAVVVCQRLPNHEGKHREEWMMLLPGPQAHRCVAEWEGDDRIPLPVDNHEQG
jgi:hypothetical protein